MQKPNPRNDVEKRILEKITKYCQATYYPDLVERMIEIQWTKWKLYGIYHAINEEKEHAEDKNKKD